MSAPAAIPSAFSPFRPSPAAADAIFAAIAAGRSSPADLAQAHHTTLEAFALWLESREARDRLDRISTGLATFARIGAMARLPAATQSLSAFIEHFNARCAASAAAAGTPGSHPVPSPMDDIRERRLIFSASCLILRITRTPDRPRPFATPVSAANTPRSAAAPHTAQRHESSARGMRSLRPESATIDPLAQWDRPPASAGPAARLERLADPALRARQSPDAWRDQVEGTLATIIDPDQLPQVLAAVSDMDDDEVCEMLLSAANDARGDPQPAPESRQAASPALRRTSSRGDSPASLLAAAGAAGPAP